jgi:hypothetical protein
MGCFHMIFFGGPGCDVEESGFTQEQIARIFVVAHPIYKCVPILRNIYAAFGVIGGKEAVKAALERGDSIVVTPCGFKGKYLSITHGPSTMSEDFWYSWKNARTQQVETVIANSAKGRDFFNDCVFVLKPDSNLAIYELAKRYRARLINVLSPDEDHTFMRLRVGGSIYAAHVITLGRWVLAQRLPMLEFYVGRAYMPDYSRRTAKEIGAQVSNEFYELGFRCKRPVVLVESLTDITKRLFIDNVLVGVNFVGCLFLGWLLLK